MKKLILTLALLVTVCIVSAQTGPEEKRSDKVMNNLLLQNLKKTKTGYDRANWAGFGAAFLNLFDTGESNDLVMASTLFTILHFGKVVKGDSIYNDYEYRKQGFQRNMQLNFGIAPNSKNQLHIDAGTIGFKYAILDNKSANKNDYRILDKSLDNNRDVENIITHYMNINGGMYKNELSNFRNNRNKSDISSLPQPFLDSLKRRYPKADIEDVLIPYGSMLDALAEHLKRKPILTFSTNYKYDFVKAQPDIINLSSQFTFSRHKNTAFDLSFSYKWTADSSLVKSKLTRRIADLSFGLNIEIAKWFEVKPAFGYQNTHGPLYEDESKQTLTASVTPRLRINDQFWLPLTIKYEEKNKQFVGFLSIQYSLK